MRKVHMVKTSGVVRTARWHVGNGLLTGSILLALVPRLCVAEPPPSQYKFTYPTTVNGVQYGLGLPGDYSPQKQYHLCVCLSGAGPVTHRMYASGDLKGFGEAVGFSPIYLGIDYGTEDLVSETPAKQAALVERFSQALTDIQAQYPNSYPGIMLTGFCSGASFVTHYLLRSPNENRLIALAPSSSGKVCIPSDSGRNYVKVLFTCGSTDGNINGILTALPSYQSKGFSARLYVERGVGHEIQDSAHFEIARFLKFVSDSATRATGVVRGERHAFFVQSPTQESGPTRIVALDGRATWARGGRATRIVASDGYVRHGRLDRTEQ